jgi:lipopolysaccharide transport system ATP-binding protein
MSSPVIQVEGVGKYYRLGVINSGTFKEDMRLFWQRISGREKSDWTENGMEPRSGTVCALDNISFEVNQGDVLGIVGRNGAGKSTLLKILSKVTSPSKGEIRIKGRIASLLEVGTGFHPELTGRENIFLNGAILGMNKKEIRSKLDQIVDFSGVHKYIDTPVKRYSSGMYIRLAFAVAANLESEILVVDEVLAVGDAEFQEKCLNKMKDVSGQGRTVLFVSHNIQAVRNLCTRAIYLEHGELRKTGKVDEILADYLGLRKDHVPQKVWDSNWPSNGQFRIISLEIVYDKLKELGQINLSEEFAVDITFENLSPGSRLGFSLVISDQDGVCVFGSLSNTDSFLSRAKIETGIYKSRVHIPDNFFNDKMYSVSLICFSSNWTDSFVVENALRFKMFDDGVLKADYNGGYGGVVRPKLLWETQKMKS